MPFHRIHDEKAISDLMEMIHFKDILGKYYFPGVRIFPLHGAGPILRWIDIAFWTAFTYVLGSIFLLLDSLAFQSSSHPEYGYFRFYTFGNVIFVISALISILDWWQYKNSMSFLNIEFGISDKLAIAKYPDRLNHYYLVNNLFFLAAAVVFFFQSLWMENSHLNFLNCNDDNICGYFWLPLIGNGFYFLSALMSAIETYDYRNIRYQAGLPLEIFFTNVSDPYLEWFGWGDIWYLIASSLGVVQGVLQSFSITSSMDSAIFYVFCCTCFLFDSLLYMSGYMVAIFEIRHALKSGYLSKAQMARISEIVDPLAVGMKDMPENDATVSPIHGTASPLRATAAGPMAADKGRARESGRRSFSLTLRGSLRERFSQLQGQRISLAEVQQLMRQAAEAAQAIEEQAGAAGSPIC